MATKYGGNHAQQPGNNNESSNSDSITGTGAEDVSSLLGYSEVTFDVLINMHLIDCDQCRKASLSAPVGLGQKPKMCDAYWQLQLLRAQEEGRVNNIVAYTENGDPAEKRGRLE